MVLKFLLLLVRWFLSTYNELRRDRLLGSRSARAKRVVKLLQQQQLSGNKIAYLDHPLAGKLGNLE